MERPLCALLYGSFALLALCSCTSSFAAPTSAPMSRTPQVTTTRTLSPTATGTATATPTPLPTATAWGGGGTILISYSTCADDWCQPSDRFTTARVPTLRTHIDNNYDPPPIVVDSMRQLLDVSPDHRSQLYSEGQLLYVSGLDGSQPVKVADNLEWSYGANAYWLRSGEIAYIGADGGHKYIYLVNSDGSGQRTVTGPRDNPYQLLPSANPTGVLWESGWREAKGIISEGLRWTPVKGNTTSKLGFGRLSAVSPIVPEVAIVAGSHDAGPLTKYTLLLVDALTMESREVSLPFGGRYINLGDLAWTPDGRHLLLHTTLSCEPDKLSCDIQLLQVDLEGNLIHSFDTRPIQLRTFSPDGKLILAWKEWQSSPPSGDRLGVDLVSYDLETGSARRATLRFDRGGMVRRAIWLPAGAYPALPNPTPVPTWTPGPSPTARILLAPIAEYPEPVMWNMINDAILPIIDDRAFQRDAMGSDPLMSDFFPMSAGRRTIVHRTFLAIPLEQTCAFVMRQYPVYGWADESDRNRVLARLVQMLGNPDPRHDYPYCPNFDPAQNSSLDLRSTTTPAPQPTRVPVDPGP